MTSGPLGPIELDAAPALATDRRSGPLARDGGTADAADTLALRDVSRFSPPVGLWCPWCRTPFVGSVDRETGRFAHGDCPVAKIDVARLEALARDSWFWGRFRERLLGLG